MKWEEFQNNYFIEVIAVSTVATQFSDNTPLYPVERPALSKVLNARVVDKKTCKTVREYPIEIKWDELRLVHNRLRKLIIRDFQIVETGSTRYIPKSNDMALKYKAK